jgi:hypothetical protein
MRRGTGKGEGRTVGGLDVPVDEAAAVQVVQGLRDLDEPAHDLPLRRDGCLDQRTQHGHGEHSTAQQPALACVNVLLFLAIRTMRVCMSPAAQYSITMQTVSLEMEPNAPTSSK